MPARPEGIHTLHLILTSRCNLRCSYCYQDEKKPGRMEWETLRTAIDLGLSTDRRKIEFAFFGGEPLLEFPLLRRGILYAKRNRPPGKEVDFEVTTNGLLLREDVASFLARQGIRLRLSFDGVPEAQSLRGAGTFARLDALLDTLRRRHPRWFPEHVSVNSVVVPETVRFLADSVAYFLGKGVGEILVTPAVAPTPTWRKERIAELDEAYRRIFDLSLAHWERTRAIPVNDLRPPRAGAEDGPRGGRVPYCGAPHGRTPAVDVGGEMLGCGLFSTSFQRFSSQALIERIESMRIGRIDEPGFRKRFAAYPAAAHGTGLFDDKQEMRTSYRRCRDCRYIERCSICPILAAKQVNGGPPDRIPDFACAFNLVTLKWQDRFARLIRRRESEAAARLSAASLRIRRLARALSR